LGVVGGVELRDLRGLAGEGAEDGGGVEGRTGAGGHARPSSAAVAERCVGGATFSRTLPPENARGVGVVPREQHDAARGRASLARRAIFLTKIPKTPEPRAQPDRPTLGRGASAADLGHPSCPSSALLPTRRGGCPRSGGILSEGSRDHVPERS